MKYDSYVICTSPRSGSTLLCGLLAATEKSGKPDSHFHEPSISKWLSYYNLVPEKSSNQRKILKMIFDAAHEEGTNGTGIFGLRLQRHSFSFFIRQLNALYPGYTTDFDRFQAAFGKTLFIHLSRKNKLEQAVSYVKANQTGLWHVAADGTELERLSEPREPDYNEEEISKQLTDLTTQDKDWENWFQSEDITPLHVSYEELSSDPVGVLIRILAELDIDLEIAKGISPPVAKLSDETNRNWIKRYLAEQQQK